MSKTTRKHKNPETEVLNIPVRTIEKIPVQQTGAQGVGAIASQLSGADMGRADMIECDQRGQMPGNIRLQLVVQSQATT